jgi:hypothetical protein
MGTIFQTRQSSLFRLMVFIAALNLGVDQAAISIDGITHNDD